MATYLHLFQNENTYNAARSNDYEEPWVSATNIGNDIYRIDFNKTLLEIPLTFEIISGGTLYWACTSTAVTRTIEYKKNNGEWTEITSTTGSGVSINVDAGDEIQFKGNNSAYANEVGGILPFNHFHGNVVFNVKGNIMSLISSNNFSSITTLESAYTFSYLFNNEEEWTDVLGNIHKCDSKVVSAENLLLPATTLSEYCYSGMFNKCKQLVSAPELPATILADYCYGSGLDVSYIGEGMFYGCSSLTTAPELPATTLANNCYASMFYGCSSLTTAPALPATTLASCCYSSMFSNCSSLTTAPTLPATTLAYRCYSNMFAYCTGLTTAPELPATTLASYCYSYMFSHCSSLATAPALSATTLVYGCYGGMFQYCTSLITAPELPATTLVSACYGNYSEGLAGMFEECSNLNYIKAMFTTTPTYNNAGSWVYGVASSGTFVKNSAASWDVTGTNGVPNGWTIEYAS